MKTDSEFESVTAKIQGRDEAYKDVDVTCFVAVVEDPDRTEATSSSSSSSSSNSSSGATDGALAALRQGLDPLLQLPAGPSASGRLVVGSLDVNVGHTLPSEELIGRLPQEDARRRRAYLSNVCVTPAARRLGVARRLIQHAEDFLREQGSVQWLYVHVVHDNTAAVALYRDAMQFQVEQVESEATARALQRPRRMLLAKAL